MEPRSSLRVISILPTAAILMVVGWIGLFAVITFMYPSGGTRWLLFFSSVLALTGTILPLVAFLNRRFPTNPPPTQIVILRQALWFGLYLPTLAWLQIGRVFTPALALLLAVGLAIIEWLLRLRERSQWKPDRKA